MEKDLLSVFDKDDELINQNFVDNYTDFEWFLQTEDLIDDKVLIARIWKDLGGFNSAK
jgi:hypothetical protein